MYRYLRHMLNAADQVGVVQLVDISEWEPGTDWITIEGKTPVGGKFELRLQVKHPKEADTDGN